jgi:hypothetical protein
MMMEILRFIRWGFSGLDIWKCLLLLSLVFNLSSLFYLGTELSSNMNLIGNCLLIAVFLKWFVWDMIKHSWSRYKEDRNSLLTTIKKSDQ